MTKSGKTSKPQSLRRRATLAFTLVSFLPLLLFLYVANRYGLLGDVQVLVLLGLSLLIAGLGLLFFLPAIRELYGLLRGFLRVEKGDLQALAEGDSAWELSEVSRIVNSFNQLLTQLQENTRELENLVHKLSTLSELTELVSHIPDIEALLQVVLDRAMGIVNAKRGSIMLLDETSQSLKVVASRGHGDDGFDPVRLGEGIAGKVAQMGEPVLVKNLETDDRFQRPNNPEYETASFISMPLRVNYRVIGVLNLSKRGDKRAFSEPDQRFLTTLLSHISFALENARLLEAAKMSAIELGEVVEEKSSQLNETRRQLLQSMKLSALGQVVAGVAHELNNPLTSILGYAELLQEETENQRTRRDLASILEAAEIAARIVKNLLTFARQEPGEKRSANLNDLLRRVLVMVENDLRVADIQISAQLAPDLPPAMVDTHQMEQVFMNLINNARQAMMEGEGPRRLSLRSTSLRDRLRLEFADTGPGIPVEHREHLFEPFFTTKREGKGTGLGLSVSYGIVKAHGGDLTVTSQTGEGARFVVDLPVGEVNGVQAPAPLDAAATPTGLSGIRRMLVIDDEQAINRLLTRKLTGEGFQVDSALNGEEGLSKLLAEDYQLILCDLRMPGMDGQQVYQEAAAVKPELAGRFIFITGDVAGEKTRAFFEETGCTYLIKPFKHDALMDILAKAWRSLNPPR